LTVLAKVLLHPLIELLLATRVDTNGMHMHWVSASLISQYVAVVGLCISCLDPFGVIMLFLPMHGMAGVAFKKARIKRSHFQVAEKVSTHIAACSSRIQTSVRLLSLLWENGQLRLDQWFIATPLQAGNMNRVVLCLCWQADRACRGWC
jgi:hypothetical protein